MYAGSIFVPNRSDQLFKNIENIYITIFVLSTFISSKNSFLNKRSWISNVHLFFFHLALKEKEYSKPNQALS